MNLVGERGQSDHLFVEAVPVWYGQNGQVTSLWLSVCKEERNLTSGLMEGISSALNLSKACKKVMSNGVSAGVDGMEVKVPDKWLGENLSGLQQQLLTGTYYPQAVRSVEIPKANGGKRQLGIPVVVERLVQQAISQVYK